MLLIDITVDRDAYGFAVRPQHVQRYREYANIYKEEEEERSDRWQTFLEQQAGSARSPMNEISSEKDSKELRAEGKEQETRNGSQKFAIGVDMGGEKPGSDVLLENVTEKEEKQSATSKKTHRIQIWTEIRPSLHAIEDMMSPRIKKKGNQSKDLQETKRERVVPPFEDAKSPKGAPEEDSEDEFYDMERSDLIQDAPTSDSAPATGNAPDALPLESSFPWKEELEVLVRGGVPMALRGELWQAFVGARARRVENYYQDLLAPETISGNHADQQSDNDTKGLTTHTVYVPEKWKGQIEKDLPRTFPGHPALDNDGRNALRRLLTAYARHNPSVGYCQAMNFFAALLLLLMPEENAFWTLTGVIDDYFDGYFSEEMIESQVDQFVFEELVRERFPKLASSDAKFTFGAVNHLDYLGVQVAWVTGPWFLSIFMNMLPWESVLRVWDVLLYEGNRVMLFRTALALMELYGPALVTTKDAGDAVTLLQSLVGSTFDSSQLVFTACMGYQNVNEPRLQELRNKHRQAVITTVEERTKGLQAWRDSQGLATKLYNFKHDPKSILMETNKQTSGELSRSESGSTNADEVLISLTGDTEIDSVPDLQDQVVSLKDELCKLLEEKRSIQLRAEELETALMEMVKQDNRRQLSARVEQLEQEVSELRRALADKQEQENAMLQVLMRVEQEQKVTEDARIYAEQDASAQRFAAQVLEEKYEQAVVSLAEMEKRMVMAESMLEATLQYQSGQLKAQPSPRSSHPDSQTRGNQEPAQDIPARKIGLLARPFGLGWRDRSKGKPTTVEEASDDKPSNEVQNPSVEQETNGISAHDKE
ncbi:hypothetical protein SADUNF_Sadunf10G0166700 [Salix dunnii]|uniref:Rab-GAP TBC domain-containing protein n=1 Tax=Salix dunnii TaxID=1413687 RepID=A0A835JP62_9ROSI|nr:hypothetical protein SADUNF_Sadunf10G0166700 [Salix dunnii]